MESSNLTSLILPNNNSVSIKLTENNHLFWKQQILATVIGYGLESYLDGSISIPPSTITSKESSQTLPNPEYLAWRRQDQLLASWIQSSLSESSMVIVVGLSTSAEIWKALETNFASQSKAKVMQYKLLLQTVKKESLSMREYLNKVKSYCDLLGAAGCRILDEDQILYILGGLGDEYNPVMVAITSKSDGWTVQDVGALLLSFESRLEAQQSPLINSDGSQPSLNLAQPSSRSRFNYSPNSGRGGRGGRGSGFRGGRGGYKGKSTGNRPVCQLCQKPGHMADRCWHRFEQNFMPQPSIPRHPQQQPPSHYGLLPTPTQHVPTANVAQARGPPSFHTPSEYNMDASFVASWYPDSGASNHVTNDLSNLNSSTEYNGGNLLHLGDGRGVRISHVGNSCFTSSSSPSARSFFLNNLLRVPIVSKNLLSVSHFARDNNVFFEFHSSHCFVRDQVTKEILLRGILDNGLYRFVLHHNPPASTL